VSSDISPRYGVGDARWLNRLVLMDRANEMGLSQTPEEIES